MDRQIGVHVRWMDLNTAIMNALEEKGFIPLSVSSEDIGNPEKMGKVLITDDRIVEHFERAKDILVSFPTLLVSPKIMQPNFGDMLIQLGISDFIELEIKEGKLAPEFMFYFKVGVLYKLAERNAQSIPNVKSQQESTKAMMQINPQNSIRKGKMPLVVIGSSAGGPGSLLKLLSNLNPLLPPVIIVQHISENFAKTLAERLNSSTTLRVKLAEDNEILRKDTVYIAPPNYHLEVLQKGKSYTIKLSEGARVNFVKPAVDVTLFSLARIETIHTIAIILTGMGHDGREGCKVVKKANGTIIALSKDDSVVFGMNRSIIEAGLADFILDLNEIPRCLNKLLSNFY